MGRFLHFLQNLLDCGSCLFHFFFAFRRIGKVNLIGTREAFEPANGEGNCAQGSEFFFKGKVLFLGEALSSARDEDAQEGNLIFELTQDIFGEGGALGGRERTGIEAVFEGVVVAARGAAFFLHSLTFMPSCIIFVMASN